MNPIIIIYSLKAQRKSFGIVVNSSCKLDDDTYELFSGVDCQRDQFIIPWNLSSYEGDDHDQVKAEKRRRELSSWDCKQTEMDEMIGEERGLFYGACLLGKLVLLRGCP